MIHRALVATTVIMLSGCAGLITKKQVARDLSKIIHAGNCRQTCESLKMYIQSQMEKK